MKKLLIINGKEFDVTGVNDTILRVYRCLFTEWYTNMYTAFSNNMLSAFTIIEMEINAQAKNPSLISSTNFIDDKYDGKSLEIKVVLVEVGETE